MAEKEERTAARLLGFLAWGLPAFSRGLAVVLVLAGLAIAFLEVGGYDEGTRADLAMLLAAVALLVLALGRAVPWLMLRFRRPRR